MLVIFNIVLMFVACYLTYVFAIEKRPKRESSSQQSEQPEQSETDYERPNVFYSKDIQIVSEPSYLMPPYRYSDAQRMTVELLKDKTVLFCCLIDGNLVSIKVKEYTLYCLIESYESEILKSNSDLKHLPTPIDMITNYLFDVKIFKY